MRDKVKAAIVFILADKELAKKVYQFTDLFHFILS